MQEVSQGSLQEPLTLTEAQWPVIPSIHIYIYTKYYLIQLLFQTRTDPVKAFGPHQEFLMP